MIIKDIMCYARLVQIMTNPEFVKACNSIMFSKPDISNHGMAGYIETEVYIETDLTSLPKLAEALTQRYNHEEYLAIYKSVTK